MNDATWNYSKIEKHLVKVNMKCLCFLLFEVYKSKRISKIQKNILKIP